MLVPEMHLPSSAPIYEAALEGLVRVNVALMKAARATGRPLPALDGGSIHYAPMVGEVWRHADEVARTGWGNCHDLAAYEVAALRVSGKDPRASVHVYRTGPKTWHAVTKRGDGTISDPSARLGMHTTRGRTELHDPRLLIPRGEEHKQMHITGSNRMEFMGVDFVGADYIGLEPAQLTVTLDIERLVNGYRATLKFPLALGQVLTVRRDGTTAAHAKTTATDAVTKVFDKLPGPVKDLLPPEAKFAINILKSKTARNIAKQLVSIF